MARAWLALGTGCLALAAASTAGGTGYLTQWGACGFDNDESQEHVTVSRSGDRVFVTEGPIGNRVLIYNAAGKRIGSFEGMSDSPLSDPRPGASADGLWVVNPAPGRHDVQRWVVNGAGGSRTFRFDKDTNQNAIGELADPVDVLTGAISSRDLSLSLVYVLESSGSVEIFNESGQLIGNLVGGTQSGRSVGGTSAGGGYVFVTDPSARAVVRYLVGVQDGRLTNTETKFIPAPEGPVALSGTDDGYWLVTEATLQKFSPDGAPGERIDSSQIPGGWGNLSDVTADKSGNVYVVDNTNGRIVKLGAQGERPPTGGGPGSPKRECDAGGGPPTVTVSSASGGPNGVTLGATPDQDATLTASGTASVPGAAKVYRLRSVTRRARARVRTTLKLAVPKRARGAVKRALKRRKRVSARIRIVATTAGGQTTTTTRNVRLRRR